jgi:heme exporter protein CcmD
MMAQSHAMGSYGSYVWSAYAASALPLLVAIVLTLRAYFRAVEELRRIEGADQASSI